MGKNKSTAELLSLIGTDVYITLLTVAYCFYLEMQQNFNIFLLLRPMKLSRTEES
jgi:hypothetical protein